MKRTMTTSGLVVAALALRAFAMSTLAAKLGGPGVEFGLGRSPRVGHMLP